MTLRSSAPRPPRKHAHADRSHNPWHEGIRRAGCGKSARPVRGGGGWRRTDPPWPRVPRDGKCGGGGSRHRASPRPYRRFSRFSMSGSAIIPRRPAERARSGSTSRGGRLRRPVRGLAARPLACRPGRSRVRCAPAARGCIETSMVSSAWIGSRCGESGRQRWRAGLRPGGRTKGRGTACWARRALTGSGQAAALASD